MQLPAADSLQHDLALRWETYMYQWSS